MELDPQPRRDHGQGGGAGLRKLDFFRFGLFLNSSATDIVFATAQARQLKQQLRSAQVAGQWRGDTALTLPLFRRRSTVSPVFFGRVPRSSLSLSRPLPTLSPSLIGHLASVDVKQHESKTSSYLTNHDTAVLRHEVKGVHVSHVINPFY